MKETEEHKGDWVVLLIQDGMELNVLQVAVDSLIEHLLDVLECEEPEERHIIEERLEAALRLKRRLDGPQVATPDQELGSSLVLQSRFHDRQWDRWTEWEDITGHRLIEKYGGTESEWKVSCKNWIDMGGRYEYRILRREDVVAWSMSFTDNPAVESNSQS